MSIVLASGLCLGGRFVLTSRIAHGGMGEVWAGVDQVLGREVAVKVLRPELVDSAQFLTRFRAEARHAGGIAHPGVAHVYDYGEDDRDGERLAYLVMELVPGEALSELLDRRGALPVAEVVSVLTQTADALHAAHSVGIVHRDVKPGNLLVAPGLHVKVTDFGIARAAASASITEVGHVVGTARYMSPEQAVGVEATPASDVYSLAIVGYEMLTGRPPFDGDTPAAVASAHVNAAPPALPTTVPADLRLVLMRALSKDPASRPQDGAAMARELRQVAASSSPGVAPAPATTPFAGPPSPPPVRRPAVSKASVAPSAALPPLAPTSTALAPPQRGGDTVVASPQASGAASRPLLGEHWLRTRRLRRRASVAAVVIALLGAGAIALALAGRSSGDDGASAGGSSTASLDSTNEDGSSVETSSLDTAVVASLAAPVVQAASTVMVDRAIYLGAVEADARTLLEALGFVVVTSSGPSASDVAGLVVDVEPNGMVPTGATVTVVIGDGTAPAAPGAEERGKDKDKDKGKDTGG